MKIFLVGGAVRDQLLNIPIKDKDWVVVGASPNELKEQGFQQVGADFPVFLHPDTKEEYALARTERKSGHGYGGFQVSFEPDVTLEEDLLRRDLTINAMAQDADGVIFDPYNGQKDLQHKVLRHVSPAFREDPLRVLRVARFCARFTHLGFTIAPETEALMKEMAQTDELNHLTAERVWVEMYKALQEPTPSEYFWVLKQVGALKKLFPELDRLFGVPQPMQWHPEVDTGIHSLKTLDIAHGLTEKPETLLSALCHDLGKGLTDENILPSHHGHEGDGADLIKSFSKTYKWPTKAATLCEQVARFHTHCHQVYTLKASTIVKLLSNLNGFRQPENVEQFVIACQADAQGRSGFEKKAYPQSAFLLQCLKDCSEITAQPFIEKGIQGKALGDAIHQARIAAVKLRKKSLV